MTILNSVWHMELSYHMRHPWTLSVSKSSDILTFLSGLHCIWPTSSQSHHDLSFAPVGPKSWQGDPEVILTSPLALPCRATFNWCHVLNSIARFSARQISNTRSVDHKKRIRVKLLYIPHLLRLQNLHEIIFRHNTAEIWRNLTW